MARRSTSASFETRELCSSSTRDIWATSRVRLSLRPASGSFWVLSRGTTMRRDIPGPVGHLEALLEEPAEPAGVNRDGLVERGRGAAVRAAVVFGHPHTAHGGTMHTKVVFQAAK